MDTPSPLTQGRINLVFFVMPPSNRFPWQPALSDRQQQDTIWLPDSSCAANSSISEYTTAVVVVVLAPFRPSAAVVYGVVESRNLRKELFWCF